MRILVTGSRSWTDRTAIMTALIKTSEDRRETHPDDNERVLIHGGAPGADRIAADIASNWLWTLEPWPANWGECGPSAGPMRNQAMVDAGADTCLAFPTAVSIGTRDCMRRAKAAGIPAHVWEAK